MGVKSNLILATANFVCKKEDQEDLKALERQKSIFTKLIQKAANTKFGLDHQFSKIKTIKDYQELVPIRDYEKLKSYFDLIHSGKKDILWPGLPKYLAKTSGTTSGTKYIPLTKQSIPNHINSARNALFSYLYHHRDTAIFDGQMLFLSGSPELTKENGILIGRLSGIVNHEIPSWMTKNKLPNHELNSLAPWEYKIEKIVEDIVRRDLRVISGIPPWIQMFLEKVLQHTGKKTIADVFPKLDLYIHGGVNFQPYKSKLGELFGKEICYLETYPASEGFIAYQDNPNQDELRLICNSGIFYEFVPAEEVSIPNPKRLAINEVELGKDYAIVLSSNAGLWSYLIGDLVRFTALNPYKIKVSGRVSQYISAFGEHVISSEIDYAISVAQNKYGFKLVEFAVAPQINPSDQTLAYHEWFIEFEEQPANLKEIAATISAALAEKNSYYHDLIQGNMLDCLKIRSIRRHGFKDYLISINKYGEQFKVPRLSNDRKLADILANYQI